MLLLIFFLLSSFNIKSATSLGSCQINPCSEVLSIPENIGKPPEKLNDGRFDYYEDLKKKSNMSFFYDAQYCNNDDRACVQLFKNKEDNGCLVYYYQNYYLPMNKGDKDESYGIYGMIGKLNELSIAYACDKEFCVFFDCKNFITVLWIEKQKCQYLINLTSFNENSGKQLKVDNSIFSNSLPEIKTALLYCQATNTFNKNIFYLVINKGENDQKVFTISMMRPFTQRSRSQSTNTLNNDKPDNMKSFACIYKNKFLISFLAIVFGAVFYYRNYLYRLVVKAH